MKTTKKKAESKGHGLVDLVFSWSIADVMNKNLYSDKVKQIPATFSSPTHYLNSFLYPLIEETHADLFSNMTMLSRAPSREVFDVKISKDFKLPKELYYSITLKQNQEDGKKEGSYEPEFGDLIALADVRPKCIDDLNKPKRPYTLVLIQGRKDDGSFRLPILSSKAIEFEKQDDKKGKNGGKLFAVYLTNLTTNIRIWKALNPDPEVANMKIISSLLQVNRSVGGNCLVCSGERTDKAPAEIYSRVAIRNLGLDKSQETAVLNCITTKDCHHQNMVKLIWGPPGTGKTKTVASLLLVLLQMKCRTLTCAPTNVAVLGVTNRLMNLVMPTLEFDTYGLGDIVLFGNGERMKIDDYEELFDIFLDYRVKALSCCFAPLTGWKGSIESIICLLEDPKNLYQLHLKKEKEKEKNDDDDEHDSDEDGEQEEGLFMDMNASGSLAKVEKIDNQGLKDNKKDFFKKVIVQTLKENKKKKPKEKAASQKLKHKREDENFLHSKKNRSEQSNRMEDILTFDEFFLRKFNSIWNRLLFCLTSLYTHMPTSFFPKEVAKNMVRVGNMLQVLRTLVHRVALENEGLSQVLCGIETAERREKHFDELQVTRMECLAKLKHLQRTICLPNLMDLTEDYQIRNFCLKSACLIFCTASSSAKLHTEGMQPLEILVIDEAAQLKECESTLPLQLPGLRHAILIGDEKQLPAMVQSKICEKADFGRSLFERLVMLGHQKHLLSVQYRMHPSISLFPNKEFYGKQIMDGPNVRSVTYEKRFLKGSMFGSYSFIDINHGNEQFDDRHSRKNLVEVYVVAEIVSNLHKESLVSKQKVRVGCISPYKAQVFAIQEKLGNKYSTDIHSDFSVNVRSVDGFQGGEEDVIIISTVRCNGNGSVGFMSNHQRTNVALTRARHCLWILGNSATLVNSHSIWKKLVSDAKARSCFYNAREDESLVLAVSSALIELGQFDKLLILGPLMFKTARWKLHFSDEFSKSLAKIRDSDIHKEVLSLLMKLSSGWRQPQRDTIINETCGTASLLMELCDVKGLLKLIWTIDIQRENSTDIQVIKVWDILRGSEIPKLAKRLDNIFGNYTLNTLNRCRSKQMEGNIAVPVTWPADGPTECMISKLAAINLNDDPKPSSSNYS